MATAPTISAHVGALIKEELGVVGSRREHMSIVFEEIKDLTTDTVVGYEALTRVTRQSGQRVNPVEWFHNGRHLGLMAELEARAIELAGQYAPSGNSMIAVNVSPDVLDTAVVQNALRGLALLDRPIVVELSEHHHTDDIRLQSGLDAIRRLGMSVAVDDAGTGDSDAAFIYAVRPDVIKIDHTHTWALNYSFMQRQFVRKFIAISKELDAEQPYGCRVVVEGVSSKKVAEAVKRLAAQEAITLYGQGFWVAKTTELDLRANAV